MEGYIVITMDEITKDLSEEDTSQMLAVRKQGGAQVERAQSNALAVYEEQEVASEKKGFFGKPGRKSILPPGQLVRLIQDNIQAFPEHEGHLLRAIFNL